jgi:hypothetical protein
VLVRVDYVSVVRAAPLACLTSGQRVRGIRCCAVCAECGVSRVGSNDLPRSAHPLSSLTTPHQTKPNQTQRCATWINPHFFSQERQWNGATILPVPGPMAPAPALMGVLLSNDSFRLRASVLRALAWWMIQQSCGGPPSLVEQRQREKHRDREQRKPGSSRRPSAGPRTTSPTHSQTPSVPPPPRLAERQLGPGRGISGRRSLP